MDNLVEVREALTPLERDVGVKKLLILLNVAGCVDLEGILIEMADHAGVGGSLLAGVVERSATGSHTPGLMHRF